MSRDCPQCKQRLTQVGKHWICPEHGEVSPEKASSPLRIFLSYGHDANEELVRRIYADLKQRGHDVWFDKHDITFGDDWRRSITSGITECDRFFSFLSKHSTRDPGVCLDEIRIAIGAKGGNIQSILVESEQEVKLPPSISHIQWLDMHDWQERRAAGEAAWENWYQQKLAEIIRVVESDESRKFAGEIRTLEEYLKPVVSDFAADARIQKLLEKKLTGRAWLFEAVEKWRTAADRSSRIFWMMGAPGFGKSFFAAHLAHFYGRGTVVGVHFCAYDKPDHRSAPRIIRTLAFQLATRLPDYRKLLLTLPEIVELDRKQTAAELFDYLLANPLKLSITGGRERLLIVIDALDEAGGDGRNELVEMLARHAPSLPDWIGLVVTSRPESDVRAPLQGLNPFILDTATEANRADLREYLRHELAPQLQPRTNADRLVEQILEKSEGVFLYAEHFCDDVQRGHLSLDHPEQFPQGLGGIFFQWFQRQFPDAEQYEQKIEPMLGAILAAREPLPVEILQKLFNWRETELRKWLRKLGSLFPVAKENDCEVIKPYHKSLTDWLGDHTKAGLNFVSIADGTRLIGKYCAASWRQGIRYALSEAVHYLAESSEFSAVGELLYSADFQRMKCSTCGLQKFYEDFAVAERGARGRFGLAGVACVVLKANLGDSAFEHAFSSSRQWMRDGMAETACAVFALSVLTSFAFHSSTAGTVRALQDFIRSKRDFSILDLERERIRPLLERAHLAPRQYNPNGGFSGPAETAYLYEDMVEQELSALDAALALEPMRLLRWLSSACRTKAIYDCDGDPKGAVHSAIKYVAEELNEKLPSSLHRLMNASSDSFHSIADVLVSPRYDNTTGTREASKTIAPMRSPPMPMRPQGKVWYTQKVEGTRFVVDATCRRCGYTETFDFHGGDRLYPACPKCGYNGSDGP